MLHHEVTLNKICSAAYLIMSNQLAQIQALLKQQKWQIAWSKQLVTRVLFRHLLTSWLQIPDEETFRQTFIRLPKQPVTVDAAFFCYYRAIFSITVWQLAITLEPWWHQPQTNPAIKNIIHLLLNNWKTKDLAGFEDTAYNNIKDPFNEAVLSGCVGFALVTPALEVKKQINLCSILSLKIKRIGPKGA